MARPQSIHLAIESHLGETSALAGDLLGWFIRLMVQCKHHPLTWFSPPAEAVYQGMALGATCERFRDECGPVMPVHSTR